ncbi:MAG TPA: crosslink repair DNA glycosylase YcaQ family protein [Anaerolineae bacterium]|nr:crosslink repair DNA glycosylase YcaQ family protein [Anaerolineae bacterium]HQH39016.1 crosslink repair DNA glycosylase YcaQ family protein [Anaerolineae bacterium]
MTELSLERVQAYRARTYHLLPQRRLDSAEEAVAFVEERGFVTFWPIKGVEMPSLWGAAAGDRPVADEHDDPGHKTWDWKDTALGKKWWYYAKVLRKKATMIALDVVPYFYALSENYGAPEEDYLDQYRRGAMTQEAKAIYEALLREGPSHTIALRTMTFMTTSEMGYRFNRALDELQADFKILPVGVAQAGTWNYAFIYDCVHRHYPDLPERAGAIKISTAQRKLVELYFRSVGAAQLGAVAKVFQWPSQDVAKAVSALVDAGTLVAGLTIPEQPGDWFALADL